MDMKFKSVLVPLLLSLLLSPYADSASNDGLLRIRLKRKTLDLNNLEAARLKGRQSLKGALLKYGLNGYLVGSEEGDAVKLTNTWMLSILGRLVLVPHHRSSLLSLIQAVQTCGCHRPSATSRLLAIFIPSTNLAYLALTRKTENQLIFIMELEPFLDTLAKTMSMLAI